MSSFDQTVKAEIRVLLVEDNDDDAMLIGEWLNGRFDVVHVACVENAVRYLTDGHPDVILLDLGLPDSEGMGTVEKVVAAASPIPVVAITGEQDEAFAREVIQHGAQDYIVKGELSPAWMARCIQYAVDRKRIEEALHQTCLSLEHQVEERTRELHEKNIALKELIRQIESEKNAIREQVMANIDRVLLPAAKKLKANVGEPAARELALLERGLADITSSFGLTLSQKMLKLTAKEIRICHMIHQGLSTKEMASMLSISPRTIESHRNVIRKKLGIAHQDINLAAYLDTFA